MFHYFASGDNLFSLSGKKLSVSTIGTHTGCYRVCLSLEINGFDFQS